MDATEPRTGSDAPAAPRRYVVCNGDADGLCAAVQWRLHAPGPAVLITGLKREIELLRHVPAEAADEVTVFDVSMLRNEAALRRLLAAGVRVRWFDHHAAPPIPDDPRLDAHVDAAPGLCSSLILDAYLDGRHRAWALAGAYGDNLAAVADPLAEALGLDAAQRAALRRLGEAINYNAYGSLPTDPILHPSVLFERMAAHADPLRFAATDPVVDEIDARRRADLARALALAPLREGPHSRAWRLPDEPWSRRVVGTVANAFHNADPGRAHAVLLPLSGGDHLVSVRAPRGSATAANAFCARFGGAGRAAAAGIDRLPGAALEAFLDAFDAAW
jgi:hypothetical protein